MTTNEPALPRPLAESGTIRRLGAEVLEYPVRAGDAVVGHRVREIGLPRDALLTVIVRAGEAVLPRGSTRVEAGDQLHVVVRSEVADQMDAVLENWAQGPLASDTPLPERAVVGSTAVFTSRPWNEEADGDAAHPTEVVGVPVREHLRTRRDLRGALLVLADGRCAITGPVLAVGGARQVQAYARRRLARETDETARAWWQEVIGALAR